MITLGTDPELFVLNARGAIMSAYQALGGDNDYNLTWGVLSPDGAAVEFTVTPSGSAKTVTDRLFQNIAETLEIVSAHGGKSLLNTSVINVHELIPSHPPALGQRCSLQVFGCNPDVCIYRDTFSRPNPTVVPYRSAGGHIHIGFPVESMEAPFKRQALVFLLDATLGLASVYGLNTEAARLRKKLYGRAGYARIYDDRVEYRVLPSAFLTGDRDVAEACFTTAQLCAEWVIRYVNDGMDFMYNQVGEKLLYGVQKAINTHSISAAKRIERELQALLPADLFAPLRQVLRHHTIVEGAIITAE